MIPRINSRVKPSLNRNTHYRHPVYKQSAQVLSKGTKNLNVNQLPEKIK